MNLVLKNLMWMKDDAEIRGDVRIGKGRITEIGEALHAGKEEVGVDCSGHYLYPGLINAHDHFEMNLFPRLGRRGYANSLDWAVDIHTHYDSLIKSFQKVPLETRLLWSALKNLISGVSTAVHHNRYYRLFDRSSFPVVVLKKYAWAHSMYMDKRVNHKDMVKGRPYIFHAAEGTDEETFREIDALDTLDVLNADTVLVHGIALSDSSIEILAQRKASLVWCPASNEFLFGRTAPISKLKSRLKIALGTDSTLSGSPTLWAEMHSALATGLATPKEILRMVSSAPAEIFKLKDQGIHLGQPANVMVLPIRHSDWRENLVRSNAGDMKLFLQKGSPRVVDSEFCVALNLVPNLRIESVSKWINLDVRRLRKQIRSIVPPEYLNQNPLWSMIET